MHAAVPYSSQQAGGAQSRAIPYRSRRFGIGSSRGYAAFEWLGSTWCLRGWSQQPPWNHADASHSTSFETASKAFSSLFVGTPCEPRNLRKTFPLSLQRDIAIRIK